MKNLIKNLFKKCGFCNKNKLWFQVKQRELKPNDNMPLVKSDRPMCPKCFIKAKKYFVKETK